MQTLFDAIARDSIRERLARLEAGSARQWGKMNPAQAVAHCSNALETATGDRPMKQKLIGRIFGPLARSAMLGEKPFGRNAPTDPTFVVADERDLSTEKQRLGSLVDRFCQRGPSEAAKETHAFLGRLSGEEWGCLMYKHLDHHLRQFGV